MPDLDAVACFVDVFVCAQHENKRPGSNTCPSETDLKFRKAIATCKRLVLYATLLTQPKAFSRVWCLFELLTAIMSGTPVIVAMSGEDRVGLRRLLLKDFGRLKVLFTTIKPENAEATRPNDIDMICPTRARRARRCGRAFLTELKSLARVLPTGDLVYHRSSA